MWHNPFYIKMRTRFALLFMLAAAMLQCVSCRRQLDTEYEFEVHVYKEDPFAPAAGDTTGTPRDTVGVKLDIDITLFKETKHQPQLHTINAFLLRAALGDDYHKGMTADKAIATYCAARHKEFDTTLAMMGASSSAFCWSYDITSAPVTVADEFVTYQQNDFIFTGGAHPNHGTQYYTFSLKTGKLLTEKDLFNLTAANKEAIKQLLLKQLQQYCDTAKLDMQTLDIQALTLNGNFLIKESNIVFHYNPYEIAPYAVGDIDIEIPSYMLHDYLNPDAPLFKYWFNENNSTQSVSEEHQ